MMNEDVKRVVDALFADIEESDEVCSIHDEVMNNCQERYENLVSSGYSPEDAIGAVLESLKGMDEVLRDYPRKARWQEMDFSKDGTGSAASGGDGIPWDRVRALKVSVNGAAVWVYETAGSGSLNLIQGENSLLKARVDGDTLVITQEKRAGASPDASEPQGLLGALAKLISTAVNMDSGSDCKADIGLPAGLVRSVHVTTLSGDITFNARAEEAVLQTTSGDLDLSVPERNENEAGGFADAACGRLQASTISGDLEVRGSFVSAALNSTSGDLSFTGRCGDLKINTVSGDAEAETSADRVNGSTVSGDLELRLPGVRSADVSLQTVSGDVCLAVPDAKEGISVSAFTRSGDVSYHNVNLRDGAPMTARITTVSGDVEVVG